MQLSPDVPNLIYWMIGVLVVTNVGTILSVLYFGGKIVWWASSIDQRMSNVENHVRIVGDELDQIRNLVFDQRRN